MRVYSNSTKRIIDLMGNTRGKLSQRRELFCSYKLILRLFKFLVGFLQFTMRFFELLVNIFAFLEKKRETIFSFRNALRDSNGFVTTGSVATGPAIKVVIGRQFIYLFKD